MLKRFLVVALLLLGARTQDPAALIEQLRSDDIAVRERAFVELEKLGAAAEEALKKAVAADPKGAPEAGRLLRVLELDRAFSPALKRAAPGIVRRLAFGEDAWTDAFLKIAEPDTSEGRERHPELRREDFKPLALEALRRARGTQRIDMCRLIGTYQLRHCEPELVRLLRDGDGQVAAAAAYSLHQFRGAAAMELLVREAGPGGPVVLLANWTVGQVPASGESGIPALVSLTRHEDVEIRSSAFKSLHRLRAPEAASAAFELSTHASSDFRKTAVEAFKELGSPAAAAALLKLLEDSDGDVRDEALNAVEYLNVDPPGSVLQTFLRDRKPGAKCRALRILSRLGTTDALPEVLRLLDDPAEEVRSSAVEALGILGHRDHETQVIRLLADEKPSVRRSALTALEWLKSPAVFESAMKSLDDTDLWVRDQALQALSRTPTPPPADRLVKFLAEHTRGQMSDRERAVTLLAGIDPALARSNLEVMIGQDGYLSYEGSSMVRLLAGMPDPVPLLVQALAGNRALRTPATQVLLAMGPDKTADRLSVLVKEPRGEAAPHAARLLGAFRIESARTDLAAMLDDSDPEVRTAALEALADLGAPELEKVRAMARDEHADVRAAAARVLRRYPARESLADVRRLREDSDDVVVREAAQTSWDLRDPELTAWALLHVKSMRSGGLGYFMAASPSTLEDLTGLLEDRHPWVRGVACSLLARSPEPPSLRAFLPLLREKSTQGEAASVLAGVKAGDAIPNLVAMLGDSDVFAREGALEALAVLGQSGALPAIRPLLTDPDGNVRLKAIEVLGRLEDRESIPAIRARLKDRSPFTREAAVEALDALQARDATPDLIELLKDPDERVHRRVCEMIGNLGVREAIPELLRLLRSREVRDLEEVCRALGRLRAREAVPDLIKAAGRNLYDGAMEALVDMKAPDAIPILDGILARAGFGDLRKGKFVRPWEFDSECMRAAEWLANIGDTSVLRALLKFPLPDIRRQAARELCALGDFEGVPAFIARTDPYDETPFHVLNRLRRPEPWKRLSETRLLVRSPHETRRSLVEKIAREAGLKVRWDTAATYDQFDYAFDSAGHVGWTDLISALDEAFDINYFHGEPDPWVVAAAPVDFILEEDHLRVLPREEVVAFWKKWWADEQAKRKK